MRCSCVLPPEPGGDQKCPICKTEIRLQNESDTKLPLWHEAEVGAPMKKKKKSTKPSPEVAKPPFPVRRMPSVEGAKLHGYRSVKDWYLSYRGGGQKLEDRVLSNLAAEFAQLENQLTREDSSEDERGEHKSAADV
eukprot:4140788-Karenia_brevis.AAC.1